MCFISKFFEEELAIPFLRLRIPKRILVPFLVILAVKIAGSLLIYYSMNVESLGTFWSNPTRAFNWIQNRALLENTDSTGEWQYTFLGWDSSWYLSIMTKGYTFSPQSYTFSPGLPAFGKMFSLGLQDPVVSLVACGLVFGVLWIPVYQIAAEKYLDRKTAFISTMLFGLSPYVFLFTTVAYSEGLLLFFVLLSWYFMQKDKMTYAALFAAVSAVTRVVGIAMIAPLLIKSLRKRGAHWHRNILLSFAPAASLLLWYTYCGLTTGDYLATIHTTEWSNLYSLRTLLFEVVPTKGIQAFIELPTQTLPSPIYWLLPFAALTVLIAPPFLIYLLWIDGKKMMAMYTLTYYMGILAFGALVSTPRFISILFPLWIPVASMLPQNKKTTILLAVILTVFLVINLDMWISFLDGYFVA